MRWRGRLRVVASIGVTCLVTAIAGCAADPTDGTGSAPTAVGSYGGADDLRGEITVLAAASLTDVLAEIGTRFEAEHPGVTVTFSFGASSELATQVLEGAPADVLATASTATMEPVVAAGLAAGLPEAFVTNQLEIAVPAGNPGGVEALADLVDPELVVALCAPQVPCGAAATQLLDIAGLDVVPDTLEEDVRAALTKVELGEVDAALVYRTDVIAAAETVEGIAIADSDQVVNTYPIAQLVDAAHPEVATAFVRFVRSTEAAEIFEAAGFGVP